ncbi:nickel-responsive transcriptional regulator NikR [Undibacterium terreum]|uniref:Putative nickel-responsive regulator n=1 Tax=Undibacterium terreum TaxID=1224302 RepID=A0A916XFD6_9BURK|nr:nickel-responsive transcriptional regulator NikR [Undibacterium terreum]GGC67817.1 putative nickel-responsive regulator [Undibacterium terreum]
MRRLTISVDDDLADAFDQLVEGKGYLNRSEAFRDLVRKELGASEVATGKAKWCVATVSYVYDHHERQLSNRLTQMQHDHHDIAVASQHVHLDHDNCLETVVLKGRIDDVRACADSIISQTGVRHGNVHIVSVDMKKDKYIHAGHTHVHPHR